MEGYEGCWRKCSVLTKDTAPIMKGVDDMNKYKIITTLSLTTTTLAIVGAAVQRKKFNEEKARLQNMNDIQNQIVLGSTNGLELIKRWFTDNQITMAMLKEYVKAVDVNEETRSKIMKL